jgi:hypothetical protein
MGYDEPGSTRASTTVSRPSRQDKKRCVTPFTNKLNGSSTQHRDLMRYSSTSSSNKRTLSTYSVGWVSSTHHHHHSSSDLAWGRTPSCQGKYFFLSYKIMRVLFLLVQIVVKKCKTRKPNKTLPLIFLLVFMFNFGRLKMKKNQK